ncbi:hypothetical protein DPMN_100883 [Dreissena polymorpha]|uniref:Uncharacterized protein n=1 Tax=Dreissena polymorpha TaxID=45954 RepID=A0A9D4LGJ4_DREPO|nr:hypothetical protein DPMN_100883 [Dreissena polymorpha]
MANGTLQTTVGSGCLDIFNSLGNANKYQYDLVDVYIAKSLHQKKKELIYEYVVMGLVEYGIYAHIPPAILKRERLRIRYVQQSQVVSYLLLIVMSARLVKSIQALNLPDLIRLATNLKLIIHCMLKKKTANQT